MSRYHVLGSSQQAEEMRKRHLAAFPSLSLAPPEWATAEGKQKERRFSVINLWFTRQRLLFPVPANPVEKGTLAMRLWEVSDKLVRNWEAANGEEEGNSTDKEIEVQEVVLEISKQENKGIQKVIRRPIHQRATAALRKLAARIGKLVNKIFNLVSFWNRN